MFLEAPIYHQAALASVSCAVLISCFVFCSHLAFAYHTDVPSAAWLLLAHLRRMFFPLSSPTSSVWRHWPRVRECSAAPLQPPLYVCRIVLLVPVYALTSYLAFTYAPVPPPSSASVVLSPPFAQPLAATDALFPVALPPASVVDSDEDDVSAERDFLPILSPASFVSADSSALSASLSPPTRRLSAASDSTPSRSWSSGSSVAPIQRPAFEQPSHTSTSRGQAAAAGGGQAAGAGIGGRLGIDLEEVEERTGGLFGFALHAVRDVYEVYVLYSFIALVVSVLGGEESAVEQLHLKGTLQHPWPFNLVLPPLDCNRNLLRRIKLGAAQFVFVKPVATLLSLLFRQRGFLYFAAISNISAAVAMYALVLFYFAVHHRLRSFRLLPKFLCIKVVVFFCFWQGLVLRWLVALLLSEFEARPDAERTIFQGLAANPKAAAVALRVSDWMLCIEMLPFAIAEACAFSIRDLRAVAAASPNFGRRAVGLSCQRFSASAGSFPPRASGRGVWSEAPEDLRQAKGEPRFSFWGAFRGSGRAASRDSLPASAGDESERQLLFAEAADGDARAGKPEEESCMDASGLAGDPEPAGERASFLEPQGRLEEAEDPDSLRRSASAKKLEQPLKHFVRGVRDLLVADDVLCDATDALFGRQRCRREYLLEERRRGEETALDHPARDEDEGRADRAEPRV
ncbi:organic solute transporter ostalpha protein [Toxoplasma gondii ARI]|uniref:Organic solute transporter ostalpha protein n=2 Tax=Toxoplasma gondii TaxID=5811 RepID=A0A139Y672_TOXGO|nr:organic solute transporter ostalpha protein [Toxoplasma gondii ARI]